MAGVVPPREGLKVAPAITPPVQTHPKGLFSGAGPHARVPDRGETDYPVCWYALDPRKWNKDSTHRAWRFHPEELANRARRAEREAPDTPRCTG